jgi:signal transduction histidine kinase/sugar lactone lactonase YvrE
MADGLPDPFVRAIFEDRDGNLWIGTEESGLSRLTGGRISTLSEREGLTQNHVRTIFEDAEGNLWVGTNGGLNRLSDGKFSNLTTQEGLSHDFVRAILEDDDGTIWIGTDGGGLNAVRNRRIEVYTTDDGLSSNSVRSLCQARDRVLWVGTRSGLNRFDGVSFTSFTTRDGLSDDNIRAILEDRSGDLWVATEAGGVNRLRGGEIEVFTVEQGLVGNRPRALFEDSAGRLWIGTYSGMSRWDGQRFVNFSSADGMSYDIVFAFLEDPRGDLFIGTDGGLNLLRDDRFITYDMSVGLWDDTIFQLLRDDQDYLWMSSNHGLSRVALDELYAYAEGRVERVRVRGFNRSDGMRSNQCNGVSQPAGCKTGAGELWFPTVKGAVRVDPATLEINRQPPAVLIEEVVVDGRTIDPAREWRLAAGRKKKLEVQYTALSFVAPERVRFRYRLIGLDPAWIEAGTRRTAFFTNVTPGQYRFQVVACNSDGVWNEEGASWGFVVQTPLWQTVWAYLLYLLGLAVVIVAVVRWRLRALASRNLLLQRMVAERTAELEQKRAEVEDKNRSLAEKVEELEVSEQRALEAKRRALEANRAKSVFLANMSHELRTPLNSILGFASILRRKLDSADHSKAERFVNNIVASGEHLLALINDLLDLAKIEEGRMQLLVEGYDLRAVSVAVENLMRGVAADREITIEISIPEQLPRLRGDAGKVKQILFNLLSNAVKFSPHGSTVTVNAAHLAPPASGIDGEAVRIDVIDRGIGIAVEDQETIFEPFHQADGSASREYEGTGLGLALVRRLLEMHGGRIELQSEPGVGSTFSAILPVVARVDRAAASAAGAASEA